MNDEELRQAVRRGFANPEHLSELLRRRDLSVDRLKSVRTNLAEAITSAKISSEELQRFISKLSKAKTTDEFDQVLAELRYANRLIASGAVAENSPIFTGAKQGRQYRLGSTTIKIDPVPEADALYLGTDGLIHLDEVKNTAQALRNKLRKKPKQLERMLDWRDSGLAREIRIVVATESGWTNLFAVRSEKEEAALKILIDEDVPLTIGSYDLSVAKMDELLDAKEKKIIEMIKQETWSNWNDFYRQMSTLADTQSFLGITLP